MRKAIFIFVLIIAIHWGWQQRDVRNVKMNMFFFALFQLKKCKSTDNDRHERKKNYFDLLKFFFSWDETV